MRSTISFRYVIFLLPLLVLFLLFGILTADPGTGWWNLLDSDGTTTQRSLISFDDQQTWLTIGDADALVRARGEYVAGDVVINEVLFFPDTTDTAHYRNHEWAELFNSGDTVDIGGWVVSNRDASVDGVLPAWDFPETTYLVVHFTAGTNDSDFSDGEGDYYFGDADAFSDTMDECALYIGTPADSTIIDFVNWSDDLTYEPGQAYDYALSANIWTADDYFTSVDTANPYGEIVWVPPGESMGRDSSSTDTDNSADWATLGGADAIYATPGAVNYTLLLFEGPLPPGGPATWTVMFYLNGDQNLERAYLRLLDDIEKQGPLGEVNVVVQADFRHAVAGTWRIFVQTDYQKGVIRNAQNIGEVNMGDAQTLGEFIQWAQTNFSSSKYVLFIKDHGAGWKGISWDQTSDHDGIYMGELKSALEFSVTPKLDVVVFDACLMAMVEVAAQVKDRVDMMVASEETKFVFDFPYKSIFATMDDHPEPSWTAESLAVDIVGKAKANVERTRPRNYKETYTFSAIDCRNLESLITLIDQFASELKDGVEDYVNHDDTSDNVQIHIRSQMIQTQHFTDANFIDLYHFAQLIKDDAGIPDGYKTQAQPIMNSLQKGGSLVIAEEHGVGRPNAHGLSIYFPTAQTKGPSWNPPDPPVIKLNAGCRKKVGGVWINFSNCENPYDHPWPSHLPDSSSLAKYASDPNDCKPPDVDCEDRFEDAKNHPIPPTPDFLFVQDTEWDEFLHRYYEPVADAGEDQVAFVGEPVNFNGSGSSDADGSVTHWYWDFNSAVDDPPPLDCVNDDWDKDCEDGTSDDNQGDSVGISHTFWEPGVYEVNLTVWDDHHLQPGLSDDPHSEHYETHRDVTTVIVSDVCRMACSPGGPATYYGWFAEDDIGAEYFDPEVYCDPPVYPLRISDVDVLLYDFAGAGTVDIQVGVALECSEPCDGPGTQIYESDPVTVTTFYGDMATITLPDLVCVYEPFFITIKYASGLQGETPSFLWSDETYPCDTCHAWLWWESGGYPFWTEWHDFWSPPAGGCPIIRVSGYTESPDCSIAPCDTTLETLYGTEGPVAYFWKQPPNDEFMNMRFEMPADHGGRLEGFEVAWYEASSFGTPDPDMYVWLSDGTFPLDNNAPYQAIAEFHKTFADIVWFPGYTEFDAYPFNLVFDPGELFHIGYSHAHEAGDTLAILSDDGSTPNNRASGWYDGAWEGYDAYQFIINAIICPFASDNPTFSMRCTPFTGYATPYDPPVDVFQVEVEALIGYAQNVTLSLLSVDPPENITATFNPNGVPPDFVSDVAITVGGGVPYGDYTLTFQGTGDDAQTRTCDVTLRVQPPYDEGHVNFFHGIQRASNFGAIGNADQSENFVWYGANCLYDGTVISAVPVEPYSEHMALDVYNCEHMGFIPTQHAIVYYDPDYNANIFYGNFWTEEDVISCEWDSLFVIGIMDSCVDFSIIIKIYYNPTQTPIPDLYAGIFEDWDIGDAANDWGDMDTLHNLMWMYDDTDPSVVFGIMKAPFYDEFAHNMTFVHNPTEVYPDGDSSFDCGSDPGPEYLSRLMRTRQYRYPNYWTPNPDDFSTLIVGPPFALPEGGKHIDIWINFGRNLDDGMTWKQWRRRVLRYTGFYRGEVNASDTLEFGSDVGDVVYLINYLYRGGPEPIPFSDQGDVNADHIVNIGDLVYMVSFLFKGGPPPVDYVRFIEQFWSRPSLFLNPNW